LECDFTGGGGEVGDVRFVGEEDGEPLGWDVFECFVEVEGAEEGVSAGEVDGVVANGYGLRAVFKKMDAVMGEVLFDEGAGFSNVMVSVDGEGTEAGVDFCEDGREFFDCAGAAVDKVAGEGDDVGVELGGGFSCAGEKGEGGKRFAVKVGELNDAKSFEVRGELVEGDGDFAEAEGLGFEEASVCGGAEGGEGEGGEDISTCQGRVHGGEDAGERWKWQTGLG
jgi:hypothetical protein